MNRLAGGVIGVGFLLMLWFTFLGFWQAAVADTLIGIIIFRATE